MKGPRLTGMAALPHRPALSTAPRGAVLTEVLPRDMISTVSMDMV